MVCVTIAYGMLISASFMVLKFGQWPWSDAGAWVCPALYQFCFAMSIWSHLACMLTDPGAVPIDAEMVEGDNFCQKCQGPKPPRAHHCSVCRRCIHKMDHHCPWVNNCVGARNQKHFVLFLFYVNLQCWAALLGLGSRFMLLTEPQHVSKPSAFLAQRGSDGELKMPSGSLPWGDRAATEAQRAARVARARDSENVLGSVLIVFVSVVFGLFSCVMMCDQGANILSNTTGIDNLQAASQASPAASRARPWRESVQEVMGRGPSWRWLVPVPIRRVQVKDEI